MSSSDEADPATSVLLRRIGRLADGRRPPRDNVDLAVVDGRIAWIGDEGSAPSAVAAALDTEVDCAGGLVTPGLIDAHTHPVYGGRRFAEIAARSAGQPYCSGGIAATVEATRGTSWPQLEAESSERLRAWLRAGTTTVEAKTGYHLTRDGELGTVALLAGLAGRDDTPRLSITFLAAHAVPPESTSAADYADEVAGWMEAGAQAGAESVDCFCDEGYFTVEQADRVLRAGVEAGLWARLHADELAHTGGAQLAAEIGAASADHLLRLTPADARALAAAGVTAVLCPTTALALGVRPDVGALRDAGAALALGSDHNPGMSGVTDMSVVVAQAVAALGLSVDEALGAATAGAADALRRPDLGRADLGATADLVLWDADHEGAFAWSWGLPARAVWSGGRRRA